MKNAVYALAAAATLCGCAAPGPQASGEDAAIRVSPTGSNMMRKESQLRSHGVSAYDKDAFDPSRRDPPPTTAPAGGGPR